MIAARRLTAQRIARPTDAKPADVVAALGAVQAQDYAAAKWAIGLRLASPTSDADVERCDRRRHAGAHARVSRHLAADRARRRALDAGAGGAAAHRQQRDAYRSFGLDAATIRSGQRALHKALAGGAQRTRAEVVRRSPAPACAATGVRLAFLLQRAELDALDLQRRAARQTATFALLDERVPRRRRGRARPRSPSWRAATSRRADRPPSTISTGGPVSAPPTRARATAAIARELASETIDGRTYFRAADAPAPISIERAPSARLRRVPGRLSQS